MYYIIVNADHKKCLPPINQSVLFANNSDTKYYNIFPSNNTTIKLFI